MKIFKLVLKLIGILVMILIVAYLIYTGQKVF